MSKTLFNCIVLITLELTYKQSVKMYYKAQNTDVTMIINFSLALSEYRIERKIRRQILWGHFLLHLREKPTLDPYFF